jgi:PAS domain S-box-containing protein
VTSSGRPGRAIAALPIAEVNRLAQIAARLGAARSIEELALGCEDVLAGLGGYSANGLYLVDLETGALRLLAARGLADDERVQAEATAMDRHPGYVLRTGQPLMVRDALVDPPDAASAEGPRRAVVRSRMMLPVASRGETFGAFGLASTEPNAFDAHDRAILAFVCELAATTYERLRAERNATLARERTLRAERESARLHFASLLRAVPDAVVGMRDDGRIAYWNAGAEQLLGWAEADVLQRDLTMIMPAQHRAAHGAGLARHLATGESRVVGRTLALHALHREGHEVPVELVISRVVEENSVFFLAILRDMSSRAQQELERKKDEAVSRRLANALVELGHQPDDDLAAFLQMATELVATTLDIERASIWRVADDVLLCDDLFERGPRRHSAGLRLHEATFPAYFAALAKDVPIVAVDAHTHPATSCFSTSYLEPLGIVSMLDAPLRSLAGVRGVICCESTEQRDWRDIEIRFAADVAGFIVQAFERATRRAVERRQAAVLGSVGEAVVACDAAGRITLMNPVAEALTGLTLAAAAGQPLEDVVRLTADDGSSLEDDFVAAVLRPGSREPRRMPLLLRRAERAVPVALTVTPLQGGDGGSGAVLSLRDVSADVAARRELVAQQERLQTLLSSSAAVLHSSYLSAGSPPHIDFDYVSESVTGVLGWSVEQSRAAGFWVSSVHDDDRHRVIDGLDRLLATEHIVLEYRHRHADGSWRWLRDEIRLTAEGSSTARRAVGARIDISARRRDESRLATILAVQQVVARTSAAFLADRGADPEDVIAETAAALGDIVGASRVFVARCEGATSDGAALAIARSTEWNSGAGVRADDASRIRAVDDVIAHREFLTQGAPFVGQGARGGALLLVPMRVDGHLRGVLGAEDTALAHLPAEEAVGLFELVADALVAGLQRLDDERALLALTDRLRRRTEQQQVLLDLSGDLARATTPGELFVVVRERLPALLTVEHAVLTTVFEDGRLRTRAFAPAGAGSEAFVTDDVVASAADSSTLAAFRHGRPLTSLELPVDTFADWRELHARGLEQFLVIPLAGTAGARSAFVLATSRRAAWSSDDLAWAIPFGIVVGAHLSAQDAARALRRMNEVLEQRVDERTAELRASEERFELLFQNAPQAMLIADTAGRIVQSNRGARELFGYDDDTFHGLAITELIPHESRPQHDAHFRAFTDSHTARARAMAPGRTVAGQRRDGSVFPAEVGLVPLVVRGAPQVLAGVTDISARIASQEATSRSLREKEVLLKEIHHRVKNNLQIISSLLMMQSEHVGSDDAQQKLHESVYRVRSMALIHQLFYGSESLERIDLGAYARGLAASLGGVLAPTARVEVTADDVAVPVDIAVPLGLILNELLTNAFKYGLPAEVRAGRRSPADHPDVVVEVRCVERRLTLGVFDSGPGLPENVDPATASSLGLQLVRALSRQLRGTLTLSRGVRGGLTLQCQIDNAAGATAR